MNFLLTAAAVAAGGMVGGVARNLLSRLPRGTMLANTAACVIFGMASTLLADGHLAKAFIIAGLAGALSTWSTLSKELGQAWERSRCALAVETVIALITGIVAFLCGQFLGGLFI